jgi:lipoate-protein ligase A
MDWQFLNSGLASGDVNMGVDTKLAQDLLFEPRLNTLRVYGWQPPAISIGHHQSIDEIDARSAQSAGIGVVRRPTGGRAILHANEVTYSVVMTVRGKNILDVYNGISRALVRGLRTLGVDAVLEKNQPHFPSLYKSNTSVACFASSARHEIKVAGKKLVGSAQRRFARSDGGEVVLQHGSILLGPEHKRIVEFLRIDEAQKELLRKELKEHTTDLREIAGGNVEWSAVARCVKEGFELEEGIRFIEGEQQAVKTIEFANLNSEGMAP